MVSRLYFFISRDGSGKMFAVENPARRIPRYAEVRREKNAAASRD